MSSHGPMFSPRQATNPFASAAIASVTIDGPEPITTPTTAVRAAREELDRYLQRAATVPSGALPQDGDVSRPSEGTVLAVVGDYGSGKTHLCVDLVRRSLRAGGEATTTVYLPATADSFIELFRRLLSKFRQREIIAQVRGYYADVVASLLASSELTRDLAPRIRERETDVEALVHRLRLPESEILREVQSRLSAVTESPDFATALTLLLRPAFAQAAWNWLRGEEPEEVLQERGIHEAIDTEQRALGAIGVLALLHGRPGHRFVLVVDEFQQVLYAVTRDSNVNTHHRATMASLRTLLSTCLKAGAMLVVCGVPDVLEHLDEDVRERITPVITVHPFTEAELVDYLRQSLVPVPGTAGIEPFTPDSVEALLQITDGAVRKIIQLCHHAFRRFQEDLEQIDAHIIQEIARDHLGQSSLLQVRDRIGRILDNRGWSYFPRQRVGRNPESIVDGWVRLPDSDRRCGILVADVLTSEEDLTGLRRRLDSVRRDRPEDLLLVVVNRHMSSTLEEQVRQHLDIVPLRYDPRLSFETDLIARLERLRDRAVGESQTDPLNTMRDELGRLNNGQLRIHDSVENVADRLEALLFDVHRQKALIQRIAEEPVPVILGAASSGNLLLEQEQLPREVIVLFQTALETLEDLQQLDKVFDSLFESAQSSPDGRSTLNAGIRTVLRSDRTGTALSVGIQLRSLVSTYQNAVRNWWNNRTGGNGDHQLGVLCRAYETAYEYLPISRLSDLADLAEAVDGPAARRRTTRTIEHLTASLYELGARVERAASGASPNR
jgi:type II secretory pathway predicted ATPase ExeA